MNNSTPSAELGWKKWIVGSRPRTLPAAVVPVMVGAACASADSPVWWRVCLALLVSLALQVGVNYANDYSDGIKGTDNDRVGPLRLVGSGVASASSVKRAAFIALGIAGVAGLSLAMMTTLWLLVVGACAIVAAWTYTGGPRPYGYAGLGEVFVFVFFGVVATVGTQYVVSETLTTAGWIASIAVGAYACALLVVNNLRDIPGDTEVGKRTLAVKMGDARTRQFFGALIVLAAVSIVWVGVITTPFAMFGLVGVIATRPALNDIAKGLKGRALIPVLGAVGRAQLILAITFTAGIIVALQA
jgi:1,4-dihydroxy-2-naphthoate octaprenyltransferase